MKKFLFVAILALTSTVNADESEGFVDTETDTKDALADEDGTVNTRSDESIDNPGYRTQFEVYEDKVYEDEVYEDQVYGEESEPSSRGGL